MWLAPVWSSTSQTGHHQNWSLSIEPGVSSEHHQVWPKTNNQKKKKNIISKTPACPVGRRNSDLLCFCGQSDIFKKLISWDLRNRWLSWLSAYLDCKRPRSDPWLLVPDYCFCGHPLPLFTLLQPRNRHCTPGQCLCGPPTKPKKIKVYCNSKSIALMLVNSLYQTDQEQ